MPSSSMWSGRFVPPITSTITAQQESDVQYTNQDQKKTGIKFSIDDILKPSFGRCQTSFIQDEKGSSHRNSESKPNILHLGSEENVRDMSLYDDSCRSVVDIGLGSRLMSDNDVIHDRSINQPMDISYLFNSHLANFQLGGVLDKQKVFYLPYGFHIGTQLHFMDPFGHFLPGLYARFYKNYDNGELDVDQIKNVRRFEEKTHLDNATINSARTCQDDTEHAATNIFQNICSTEIMLDEWKKIDFKPSKRTDLNDALSKSRHLNSIELKTPNCSTNLPHKKTKIIRHKSLSIKHDDSLQDNSGTNHHVTSSTQTFKGQELTGNNLKALPAWVFCTRYSDRPSSGPRYRKVRQKTKSDIDKRPRTAFSSQQLQCLRSEFESCPYLCEKRRKQLSATLSLSESQVKIWFQNKRAKLKKRSGRKNSLAMRLSEEGLYNHSTIIADDGSDQ